jgi:hypothetical protein
MKNSFILPSVAQIVRVKVEKTDRTLKALSKSNPAIYSFTVILSSKQFDRAGYI